MPPSNGTKRQSPRTGSSKRDRGSGGRFVRTPKPVEGEARELEADSVLPTRCRPNNQEGVHEEASQSHSHGGEASTGDNEAIGGLFGAPRSDGDHSDELVSTSAALFNARVCSAAHGTDSKGAASDRGADAVPLLCEVNVGVCDRGSRGLGVDRSAGAEAYEQSTLNSEGIQLQAAAASSAGSPLGDGGMGCASSWQGMASGPWSCTTPSEHGIRGSGDQELVAFNGLWQREHSTSPPQGRRSHAATEARVQRAHDGRQRPHYLADEVWDTHESGVTQDGQVAFTGNDYGCALSDGRDESLGNRADGSGIGFDLGAPRGVCRNEWRADAALTADGVAAHNAIRKTIANVAAGLREDKRILLSELQVCKDLLRKATRRAAAADGEVVRRSAVAEELRVQRAKEHRSEVKAVRAEAAEILRREKNQRMEEVRRLTLKVSLLQRQIAGQAFVPLCTHKREVNSRDEKVAALQEQLDSVAALYHECRQRELELERQHDDEESEGEEGEGEQDAEHQQQHEFSELHNLKRMIGVASNRQIPHRVFRGDASKPTAVSNWKKLTVRHLVAVLADRGESEEGIELIASALNRLGYLRKLVDAKGFRRVRRDLVRIAIDKWQMHWSARHALHIWDKLELSRSQYETLRRVLSFVYDAPTDKYHPIKVWEDPDDPNCFVLAATIANRTSRESLFRELVGEADIVVSGNGRCERDAVKLASKLYTIFANAMRDDFSTERPAQPFLYVDGTGASLGKGVSHAELGSADFAGGCKQSRSTLSPLSLCEGTDHAADLRENMSLVSTSYNQLIAAQKIVRTDDSSIPARPGASGDMQAVKALAAQCETSHPPWCKCRAEVNQHVYGSTDTLMNTYDEVVEYIREVVKCEFRSEEWMCSQSHYSYSVHRGGSFKPFRCGTCGYEPTNAEWHADLAAFHQLSDEEQQQQIKDHNKGGAHFHQILFMTPLLHLDIDRIGADQLHLIYLNFFKHLFRYTVHENLPTSKEKLVRSYLKNSGFYSYDAASEDEDPVKRWIGREVKRFLNEAHVHLPFLLRVSAAPADLVPDSVEEFIDDDGLENMQVDGDEYEPTTAEMAAEEDEEPQLMQDAARWDRFLDFVREVQTPWEKDTDEYRRQRATAYFNHSMACSRDLLELKPTLKSWVPHVSCFIVPRQIVTLGDPAKRATDASESYGAMIKHFIKKLTCRRRIHAEDGSAASSTHVRGGRNWKQSFSKGYIQQAFSRCCVRESLLHGEENTPFLQRSDWRLKIKGVKKELEKSAARVPMSVRFAVAIEDNN